jgi:integrase
MKKNNLFSYRANKYFTTREHPKAIKGEIKIVDPKQFVQFIKFVLGCRKYIPTVYKLIITLQLTLGARVSEILNLTKENIVFQNGKYYARIRIEKKRGKVEWRKAPISNFTVSLLTEWMKDLKPDEKLFNLDRSSVYRKYIYLFGIHPHCLRHSMITYQFEIQGWTLPKLMQYYHLTRQETVMRYFNTDTTQDCDDLILSWDKEAQE